MSQMSWTGVLPAITTPFDEAGQVDLPFLSRHASWLVENGCMGIIALGSLGEGATLSAEEKTQILACCVEAVGDRVPVVAGVASPSTREAVALAHDAHQVGCRGLLVLPPYVHQGSWREIRVHLEAVIGATGLSCMLYNNPSAYGTDLLPEQVAELAECHDNLHAVKESSGDAHRITAIAALDCGVSVLAGLDDVVVEGVHAGAQGWVAGLVNALPRESVQLFELAREGRREDTTALYRWFLPLLRMDTVPEFVQLIKLVQQEVGMGSERVRPPRLPLIGIVREQALKTIGHVLGVRT